MVKRLFFLLILNFSFQLFLSAQPDRWQQQVKYNLNADLDVNTNLLTGTEKLEYFNNSPDQLSKVYFHLYWNAFQPGSEMDVRSRQLGKNLINGRPDWDSRVKDRISKLDSS